MDQEILPPAGIERDTFIQDARSDITRINDLMKVLSSLFNIEPIYIELMKDDIDKLKTNDELFQEAYDALESIYSSFGFFSLVNRNFSSRAI